MRFLHLVCIASVGVGGCAGEPSSQSTASKASTSKPQSGVAGAGPSAATAPQIMPAGDDDTASADGADSQWPASDLPNIDFSLDVAVPVGAELHKCRYAAMPVDRGVIAVSGAESHFTPGSHHLLAYRTDLKSIPSNQTGVWDCYSQISGFHQRGSYYEAQQPDSHRELPNGVAHKFQPGEVILLESHYINTMSESIDAHVVLSLHTVDLDQVQQEAGTIMFNNVRLNIPPHKKTRVTMTCPITQDMNPALLWSHMHARGVNFVASSDDAASATELGTLYTEANWSEPQPRIYPSNPPVTLHAGTHITFSCDYQNDTNNTFIYGQSAETNEMCILHGMYYPRMTTPGAEQCLGGTTSSMQL